jgi:hypothetical protein
MDQTSFFGRLFDTRFQHFVTTSIISVLFIIALIGGGLLALVAVASAFANSVGAGVVVLIISPLIFLVWVIYARVLLELAVIVFRIEENTRLLAQGRQQAPEPPPTPEPAGQPGAAGGASGPHPPAPDSPSA